MKVLAGKEKRGQVTWRPNAVLKATTHFDTVHPQKRGRVQVRHIRALKARSAVGINMPPLLTLSGLKCHAASRPMRVFSLIKNTLA
jgi:hypothetical protein